MDIKPFLHEHYLLFDEYEKQKACCDKCNQQIDGWAFTCESCKFWLHQSCAEEQLPYEISHPLHSQHFLSLLCGVDSNTPYFICDKCFSLTRGCIYRCKDCNFNLDFICASSTTNDDHETLKEESERSNQRYKTINHFSHIHELTLFNYRKVEKDHYSCRWCENLLSGMSYGCLGYQCSNIEVFFHESCLIDIPTTISKHHFHPSHPLHFRKVYRYFMCNACKDKFLYDDRGYSCQNCRFYIHVNCVRLQPSLKHELHEHDLTYFRVKAYYGTLQCKMCNEKITFSKSGSVFYRCVRCDFDLHFHCLQIPLSTKHEYHRHKLMLIDSYMEDVSSEYYCDMCEKERKPKHPVYYCKKCTYVAHIGCALYKFIDMRFKHGSTYSLEDNKASIRKLTEQEGTQQRNANFLPLPQIENFHHEHPLSFTEVIEQYESILCQVCSLEISYQAYGCKSCEYYIHTTCTALPYEVLHPLHPQHSLMLFTDSRFIKEFACYECGDSFYRFFYMCSLCDFALDVKCATSSVPKSDSQRLKEMERRSKLCPFNQDHRLRFFNYVPKLRFGRLCSFCEQPLAGPSYGCFSCLLQLHECCLGFPRKMHLQFHSLHPLYPPHNTKQSCLVCRYNINRISYNCVQCGLHLHPQSVKSLKQTVRSKLHMHNLYYFGLDDREAYLGDDKCGECKERLSIPLYFCTECDIKLHFRCAQIPHSIKSKYHIHPLTLKDHFMEDDFGEYYCDICEEERYPEYHVYSCTECQGLFVAHIDCVLTSAEETALALEASSNELSGLIQTESKASTEETAAEQPRNSGGQLN